VLLVATATTTPPARGDFAVSDLGTLGTASRGNGINAGGMVVGTSDVGGQFGPTHAFREAPSGGIQDLGVISGFDSSSGTGINIYGDVAGTAFNARGVSHAFRITRVHGPEDLGTLPGGSSSFATALNGGAVVTGGATTSYGATHAFLGGGPGMLVDLGTLPGGGYSVGNAINDADLVAGTASTSYGALHAFRSEPGLRGLQDLGTLPGGDSSAGNAINARGDVAGDSTVVGGAHHAFLATVDTRVGGMIDLGLLPGAVESFAYGLNDQDAVVGSALIAGAGAHAFLWRPGGMMLDLNQLIPADSGWTLQVATGIDDDGRVTGYGTVDGQVHAFRLDPRPTAVPAPPSLVLLALGVIGVTIRYKSKRR
jgi:probable HAF family extracellular repeat protein